MSKSYRQPIYKDRGKEHFIYWKKIRREWKQKLHSRKPLRNPKEIINDYDYCDYIFDWRFDKESKWKQKRKRK